MSNASGSRPAWLAEVRDGNFAAIPHPFAWDHSIEIAHLIDGYTLADATGLGRLGPFANARLERARATGAWSGTAIELWCCLFFEHRRYRHMGEGEPAGLDLTLLDRLCASLRLQLQTITAADRRTLIAAFQPT